MCVKDSPIFCPRCNKNSISIVKDGEDYVAFCYQSECLKIDMDYSKSVDREKKESMINKQNGIKISGAQFFKVGAAYHDACLSKWIAPSAYQNIVLNWFSNNHPFLVILGGSGVGKSYVCCAILNRFFEKNYDIAYVSHRRFIDEIKNGIQHDKREHEIIQKYADKQYLIFDDLGSSRGTEWEQEMILDLIDRRYSNSSKTVFTSNLDKEQVKQKFGFRSCSRMFDQHNDIIEIWDADRRGLEQFRNQNIT